MTASQDSQIRREAKRDAYRQNEKYIEQFAKVDARQRFAYFTQIADRAEQRCDARPANDDPYASSFDAHVAHYARIQAENAQAEIAAQPKRRTTFVARGIKFRSTSNRQFILVHVDAARQRVTVERRSDSYDVVARERARRITPSSYVIINQATGEEV